MLVRTVPGRTDFHQARGLSGGADGKARVYLILLQHWEPRGSQPVGLMWTQRSVEKSGHPAGEQGLCKHPVKAWLAAAVPLLLGPWGRGHSQQAGGPTGAPFLIS